MELVPGGQPQVFVAPRTRPPDTIGLIGISPEVLKPDRQRLQRVRRSALFAAGPSAAYMGKLTGKDPGDMRRHRPLLAKALDRLSDQE